MTIPDGARLKAASDAPKGAFEVVDSADKVLALVTPSVATDAAGESVPVTAQIEGTNRIALTVEHRGKDLEMPILVDPEIQVPGSSNAFVGWTPASYNSSNYTYSQNGGLFINMPANTFFPVGSYGTWSFRAPTDTYVRRVRLYNWSHDPTSNYGYTFSRHEQGMLFNSGAWEEDAGYTNGYGQPGPNPWGHSIAVAGAVHDYCFGTNPCINAPETAQKPKGFHDRNYAMFLLKAVNPTNNGAAAIGTLNDPASAAVSYTNVYLGDQYDPTLTGTAPQNATAWVNDGNASQTYTATATDRGLGIYSYTLTGAASGNGTHAMGCTGVPYVNECSKTPPGKSLTYTHAEGRSTIEVRAWDAADRPSAPFTWKPLIDRSGPISGSLSGPLLEAFAAGKPLGPATKTLNVGTTKDGSPDNDATMRSGVAKLELVVGQNASDPNKVVVDTVTNTNTCTLTNSCDQPPTTLTFNPAHASVKDGSNYVALRATDRAGNVSESGGMLVVDRGLPTVTATHTGLSPDWTDSGTITTRLTATDPAPVTTPASTATGIETVAITGGGINLSHTYTCNGPAATPCSTTPGGKDFTYTAAQLDEGISTLTGTAKDAAGNPTTTTWQTKIDRSRPTASSGPRGTVYADRTTTDDDGGEAGGFTDEKGTLGITAADARSGVRQVELWVNGSRVATKSGACNGLNCPSTLAADFTVPQNLLTADDDNTIALIARDALAGNNDAPDTTLHTSKLAEFTVWASGSGTYVDPTDSTPDDANDGPTTITEASEENPCGTDAEFTDSLSCLLDDTTDLIESVNLEEQVDSLLDSLMLLGEDASSQRAASSSAAAGACPMGAPITAATSVETYRRWGFSDGSGIARDPSQANGPNVFRQTFRTGGAALDLNIRRVRLIVPWELVPRAQAQSDPNSAPCRLYTAVYEWIKDAVVRAPGDTRPLREPLISFEHAQRPRPNRAAKRPSPSAYKAAVEAFRAQFPAVKLFTAWNEPNHTTQPTQGTSGALRAGRYWRQLNEICGRGSRCVAVAGDFLDTKTFNAAYRRAYLDGMTGGAGRPRQKVTWAYHPYGMITYGPTGTQARARYDAFVNDLVGTNGQVWFTEGGAFMSSSDVPQRDQARQNSDLARFLNSSVFASSRVKRFYYYNWFGQPGFDTGLVGRGATVQQPALDLTDPSTFGDPIGAPLRSTTYCTLRNRSNPFITPC